MFKKAINVLVTLCWPPPPLFRPYQYFYSQNCTKHFLSFWMSKIYQNFDIWWYMSKITVEPSIKWPKFDQYLAQIWANWSKMTQKMVKNHKNYTGIFNFLPKMANFWPFSKCRKCTKIFGLFFTKCGTFSQKFTEVQNSYWNAWPFSKLYGSLVIPRNDWHFHSFYSYQKIQDRRSEEAIGVTRTY